MGTWLALAAFLAIIALPIYLMWNRQHADKRSGGDAGIDGGSWSSESHHAPADSGSSDGGGGDGGGGGDS